jgi:hypothetical protein
MLLQIVMAQTTLLLLLTVHLLCDERLASCRWAVL